jgi:hypothetical protein
MKLAEALNILNDIQKDISDIDYEYIRCFNAPAGDTPKVDLEDILEEMRLKHDKLAGLEYQINDTNKKYGIHSLIVKRDQQKRRYRLIKMGYAAAFKRRRFNNDKFRVYRDLSSLRYKMHDALAQFRQYDIEIQKLNHSTELIEA